MQDHKRNKMKIQTVKIQTYNGKFSGYKVNGNTFFPKENCELIKQWIAEGNNPEAESTEKELYEQKKVNTITMRQARLYLYSIDKLEDVEAMVETRKDWQIEWEYASEVERSSLLISIIKDKLGLSDIEVDDIFLAASKL